MTTVLRAVFTADQKSVVLVTGLSRLEATQLAITTAEFLSRSDYRAWLLTSEDVHEPPRCDMLLCGESALEQATIRAKEPAGHEALGSYVRRSFAAAQVPVFILSTGLPGVGREPEEFAVVLREAASDSGLKLRTMSLDRDFH